MNSEIEDTLAKVRAEIDKLEHKIKNLKHQLQMAMYLNDQLSKEVERLKADQSAAPGKEPGSASGQ